MKIIAIVYPLVFAGMAYSSYVAQASPQPQGGKASVPNVVDMSLVDAQAVAKASGLQAWITMTGSRQSPNAQYKTVVIAQDLKPGSTVAYGSRINLRVEYKAEKPPVEMTKMPNVVGLDAQQASSAIETAGLVMKLSDAAGKPAPGVVYVRKIWKQDLAPGTPVQKGTVVFVDAKYEIKYGVVPNVCAQVLSLSDPERILHRCEFRTEFVRTNPGGPSGDLLFIDRQIPAAGTRWPLGSTVKVYYHEERSVNAVSPHLEGMVRTPNLEEMVGSPGAAARKRKK